MGIVLEQYDNLTAFAKSLERPDNMVFLNEKKSSHDDTNAKWYGTKSYEEAMNLFQNGWTEKADEIRREFAKFERAQERKVTYQKCRPATSVVGFTPHVPNAILGLPDSMIYTERTPMKTKVVRIVYNMTMNAGTSADDILKAGLVVLKIAHSLERGGLRVRIDVNPFMSKMNRETAISLVCVKDWRQPIDIKKVAFPIAHPSMFRRLGFRWIESTPDLTEKGFAYGYGHAIEDVKAARKVLEDCKILESTDYFVNVSLAKKCGFDHEKVAKELGIN